MNHCSWAWPSMDQRLASELTFENPKTAVIQDTAPITAWLAIT